VQQGHSTCFACILIETRPCRNTAAALERNGRKRRSAEKQQEGNEQDDPQHDGERKT